MVVWKNFKQVMQKTMAKTYFTGKAQLAGVGGSYLVA